jgi:hypothetical protein
MSEAPSPRIYSDSWAAPSRPPVGDYGTTKSHYVMYSAVITWILIKGITVVRLGDLGSDVGGPIAANLLGFMGCAFSPTGA